ncbi:MAG: hypothetical protein AAF581_14530 [Planctomycetota bacterium]
MARSESWYDLTRELRQLALRGTLDERYPQEARSIRAALVAGGRIVFSPDDEQFYQEFVMDRFLRDPASGRMMAVRRL